MRQARRTMKATRLRVVGQTAYTANHAPGTAGTKANIKHEANGEEWRGEEEEKWGRGDSNSHARRHMILSHARLPVPALPPG
jgi:hypothetical protein